MRNLGLHYQTTKESIKALFKNFCEQKRVSMTEQIRGETGYYEIPGNSERHSSCKLSTIISKCLIEQVINMGKQLPGFHHVLLLMNISCKNWPNQFHWSYILMLELRISKAIKHPKNTFLLHILSLEGNNYSC